MRIFKVVMTGKYLLSMVTHDQEKYVIVENPIPDDAILISTEFNVKTKHVEFYFTHPSVGTEIPEGSPMENCMILTSTYKTISDQPIENSSKKPTCPHCNYVLIRTKSMFACNHEECLFTKKIKNEKDYCDCEGDLKFIGKDKDNISIFECDNCNEQYYDERDL